MKSRHYITPFSLIAALTALSPVVAADAADIHPARSNQSRQATLAPYILTPEQMDTITSGRWVSYFWANRYYYAAQQYAMCTLYSCERAWGLEMEYAVERGWEPDM